MQRLQSMKNKLGHTKSYDFTCETISEKVDNASKHQTNCTESRWGYRHVVAVIAFLTYFQLNNGRLSSAVAIVAMINSTSIIMPTQYNSNFSSCPPSNYTAKQKMEGEFDWNSDVVGYINGAGFFGLFMTFLPGSKLTQIFPSKRLILYSLILSSIALGISPLASRWHVYAFIVALWIRGCGEGIIVLAIFVIMANWFPRDESGLLSTFAISGFSVGAILTGIVSGWICERLGWPVVFYVTGGFGLSLSILILVALYESPIEHPRITKEEMHRIIDPMQQVKVKEESIPWLWIFSTTSTYATMMAKFGQYWCYAYFWSIHTTYLGTVLHLPISENGLFTSMPYLFKLVAEISASSLSHWLLKKGYLSIDSSRKLCTTLGYAGFSGAVLGIYFAGCHGFISIVFANLGMLFVGVSTNGVVIVTMDMTKKFTGPFSGVLHIVGSTAAFIFPVVTGYLTPNKSLEEWHSVFLLTIIVMMTSAIVFAIFGSAEVQPWNFKRTLDDPSNQEREQEKIELHI